jgi:hypothetical protein
MLYSLVIEKASLNKLPTGCQPELISVNNFEVLVLLLFLKGLSEQSVNT